MRLERSVTERVVLDRSAGDAGTMLARVLGGATPARKTVRRGRVRRHLKLGIGALACGVVAVLLSCGPAFAATSAAPGLAVFSGIDGWISQYGLAGAPVAVGLGGLLFAVEHHQQRTGNAVRAKGYIFAGCARLVVISLASTIVSAVSSLAR